MPFRQKTGVQLIEYRVIPGHPNQTPEFSNTRSDGVTAVTIGSQVTDSEEHPGWRKRVRNPSSLQDIGGDFYTQKQYVHGFPTHVHAISDWFSAGNRSQSRANYLGNVWSIDARLYPYPPSNVSTVAQLDALGATAIARCRPTNSIANVAVTLGELVREGIPSYAVGRWKDRTRTIKNGSEDYLALQFGLKPLGQEIGTFAAGVLQADQLLAQYERDAGKVVRRRYEFPPISETTITPVSSSSFPFFSPFNNRLLDSSMTGIQTGMLTRVRTIEKKRWFSGAFTYYLPEGYDPRNQMHRKALLAKEILGLDLDPETLWSLAPWSWAVDWFSNVGDVISNITSFIEDGLIMRYGYMMEHTIVSDTYTREYTHPFWDKSINLDSAVTLVTETKMRRHANPYGFGLTWDALSGFQTSILAALGISRSKKPRGL